VSARFFEWKLGQKNYTTEESAPLILHNFSTTVTTHATTCNLVNPTKINYSTINNLAEEPQLRKNNLEHRAPSPLEHRAPATLGKRHSTVELDSLAKPSRKKRRQERRQASPLREGFHLQNPARRRRGRKGRLQGGHGVRKRRRPSFHPDLMQPSYRRRRRPNPTRQAGCGDGSAATPPDRRPKGRRSGESAGRSPSRLCLPLEPAKPARSKQNWPAPPRKTSPRKGKGS
jgi:hypothetical protein